MENRIEKTAMAFLSKVTDDELAELVNVSKIEFIDNNHIIRKFINDVYDKMVPFGIALPAVMPFIARECHNRMIHYKNISSTSN